MSSWLLRYGWWNIVENEEQNTLVNELLIHASCLRRNSSHIVSAILKPAKFPSVCVLVCVCVCVCWCVTICRCVCVGVGSRWRVAVQCGSCGCIVEVFGVWFGDVYTTHTRTHTRTHTHAHTHTHKFVCKTYITYLIISLKCCYLKWL